jgi:hypothetical protein
MPLGPRTIRGARTSLRGWRRPSENLYRKRPVKARCEGLVDAAFGGQIQLDTRSLTGQRLADLSPRLGPVEQRRRDGMTSAPIASSFLARTIHGSGASMGQREDDGRADLSELNRVWRELVLSTKTVPDLLRVTMAFMRQYEQNEIAYLPKRCQPPPFAVLDDLLSYCIEVAECYRASNYDPATAEIMDAIFNFVEAVVAHAPTLRSRN